MVGANYTNVCKFSQLFGAIFSLASDVTLLNLTVFQGALFSGVNGFSLTGPCQKLKKPWVNKVLINSSHSDLVYGLGSRIYGSFTIESRCCERSYALKRDTAKIKTNPETANLSG